MYAIHNPPPPLPLEWNEQVSSSAIRYRHGLRNLGNGIILIQAWMCKFYLRLSQKLDKMLRILWTIQEP